MDRAGSWIRHNPDGLRTWFGIDATTYEHTLNAQQIVEINRAINQLIQDPHFGSNSGRPSPATLAAVQLACEELGTLESVRRQSPSVAAMLDIANATPYAFADVPTTATPATNLGR